MNLLLEMLNEQRRHYSDDQQLQRSKMIESPIIFLDIDGVLNHADHGEDTYYDVFENKEIPLCEDNVNALKKLLDEVKDAKIVWTSDWRLLEDKTWERWQNPRLFLEQQDFMKDRVIGKTPRKFSSEHFHDIKWWLDAHPEVKKYTILEDSYFPSNWFGIDNHLIRLDATEGFTEKDIEKAKEMLTKEMTNVH